MYTFHIKQCTVMHYSSGEKILVHFIESVLELPLDIVWANVHQCTSASTQFNTK
jgi:hypothetical protein